MKFILIGLFAISNIVYASQHTCDETSLSHKYYKICFNKKTKLAHWVSYNLDEKMFRGQTRRTNKFKVDPLIPKDSPKPDYYKGSGYDRGHLAPAGDMRIDTTAMKESFFMTNISPQEPSFNRGVWKRLENLMRSLTQSNKTYTVVTGPLFEFKPKSFKTRFLNIPKFFYKLIFYKDKYEVKVLAYLLPNEVSKRPLSDFLVTVDEIERRSGIDFFKNLPITTQNKIESQIDTGAWGL